MHSMLLCCAVVLLGAVCADVIMVGLKKRVLVADYWVLLTYKMLAKIVDGCWLRK